MPSIKNSSANPLGRKTRTRTTELTAEQIVQYLQQHPTFIEEHPELLDTLQLRHHPSGTAVSLIERQVAKLRDNNTRLNQRLDELVDNVRDNDQLFAKTKCLVLAIIAATNVEELCACVEQAFVEDFDADASALTIFTPAAELSTTPKQDRSNSGHADGGASNIVSLLDAQNTIKSILSSSGAICGCFRQNELAFLFNNQATAVKSAAVTPIGNGTVVGILAVGSEDPDHYHSTIGTIFLNYISEVLNIQLSRLLAAQGDDEH